MANISAETIYVLHSPVPDGLESAGIETGGQKMQDPGVRTAVAKLCAETSAQFGLKADCRQADRESELFDLIREADACQAAGIVIDAGSNTSIALHDVLAAVRIPAVEVHLGHRADDRFRHYCFAAKAPLATLSGFGIDGYRLAIHGLAARNGARAKA